MALIYCCVTTSCTVWYANFNSTIDTSGNQILCILLTARLYIRFKIQQRAELGLIWALCTNLYGLSTLT